MSLREPHSSPANQCGESVTLRVVGVVAQRLLRRLSVAGSGKPDEQYGAVGNRNTGKIPP